MIKEKIYSREYLEGAIKVKEYGIRITTTLGNKIQLESELESLKMQLGKTKQNEDTTYNIGNVNSDS